MIVKRASVTLGGRCEELIELLSSVENLASAIPFIKYSGDKTFFVVKSESKVKECPIAVEIRKSGTELKLDGVSELGLQSVSLTLSCKQLSPYSCRLELEAVLNPVALGVSSYACELAFTHASYELRKRLIKLLRLRAKPSRDIVEAVEREGVEKLLSRSKLVKSFRAKLSSLELPAALSEIEADPALLTFSSQKASMYALFVGSSYGVKLVIEGSQLINEEAIEKAKSLDEEGAVAVYEVTQL